MSHPIWTPAPERVAASSHTRFAEFVRREHGAPPGNYDPLCRWSVDERERFWAAMMDFGRILRDDGLLFVYGPFRYGGQYTSRSNRAFDETLKARDPLSGIRDFEALEVLAAQQRLVLVEDQAMPANNQTLVWRKP